MGRFRREHSSNHASPREIERYLQVLFTSSQFQSGVTERLLYSDDLYLTLTSESITLTRALLEDQRQATQTDESNGQDLSHTFTLNLESFAQNLRDDYLHVWSQLNEVHSRDISPFYLSLSHPNCRIAHPLYVPPTLGERSHLITDEHLTFRLTRLPHLRLTQRERDRLKHALASQAQVLLLTDQVGDTLSLTAWITQETHTVHKPTGRDHNVLPVGWRWLITSPSHDESSARWLTPTCELRLTAHTRSESTQRDLESAMALHQDELDRSTAQIIFAFNSDHGVALRHSDPHGEERWIALEELSKADWGARLLPYRVTRSPDTDRQWSQDQTTLRQSEILQKTRARGAPRTPSARETSGDALVDQSPAVLFDQPLLNAPASLQIESIRAQLGEQPNPNIPQEDQDHAISARHLEVSNHVPVAPPKVIHPHGSLMSQTPDVGDPFVVDYSAVLSGLDSESSTIKASYDDSVINDIRSQGMIAIKDREIDPLDEHRSITLSSSGSESDADFNGLDDQDTLHARNAEDLDQSEVIDISLSELPVAQPSTQAELDTHRGADLFEEINPIIAANTLSVDRRISSPQPIIMTSLVTSASTTKMKRMSYPQQEHDQPQGDALRSYTSRPAPTPASPDTSTSKSHLQDSNQVEVHRAALPQSYKVLSLPDDDEFDDVPTRVDLDVDEVQEALEKELDATRVKPADPHLFAENDQTEAVKLKPEESVSKRSLREREVLSREETTKLKVRDFDMLTDVRDLPSQPPRPMMPPSYPRPKLAHHPKHLDDFNDPKSAPSRPHSGLSRSAQAKRVPLSAPPREAPPPHSVSQKVPHSSSMTHTIPPPPMQSSTQDTRIAKEVTEIENKKHHAKRRSFSDVIRSLTAKNKS